MAAMLLMPVIACAQSFSAEDRKDKDNAIQQRAGLEEVNVRRSELDLTENGRLLKPESPGYRAQAKIALDALIALRHAKQGPEDEDAYYKLNDAAYQALFEADVNLANSFDARTAMLMASEYLALTKDKVYGDMIPNRPIFLRQTADVMHAACEEDMGQRLEGENSSLCMDAMQRYSEVVGKYNERRKKELDSQKASTNP
jgi:hypothetical protein